jgi:aminocarboxymuconate-semialdehyde decarboxylase
VITRRGFVAGFLAGTTATLLAGTTHAAAQEAARPPRVRVIDIHAHWYPPEWADLVQREGEAHGAKIGRNQRGDITVGLPGIGAVLQQHYIDIPSRLERMDKAGVATHALSLTQPMVYWAPPPFGLKLAQVYNDACSNLHLRYPDRFVGLAQLPMQDVELAVDELERAAKRPGIRGVYMATHVNGKNLDDKSLWPVYAACERLGLGIFLHPINPVGADRMRGYHLRNFIGNPTDTGIAAASLMFGGVLDAFPRLDVVLPHAGGIFPSLIGRMRHGATVRQEVKDLPKPPPEYIRRFHYDTIAHDKEILLNLVREVGVDRVVCGTDFPADMSDVDPVGTVERLTELSTAERDLILRGNAARLLRL